MKKRFVMKRCANAILSDIIIYNIPITQVIVVILIPIHPRLNITINLYLNYLLIHSNDKLPIYII